MFSPLSLNYSVKVLFATCKLLGFFFDVLLLHDMIGLEIQQGDFSGLPLLHLSQTSDFELQTHEKGV